MKDWHVPLYMQCSGASDMSGAPDFYKGIDFVHDMVKIFKNMYLNIKYCVWRLFFALQLSEIRRG